MRHELSGRRVLVVEDEYFLADEIAFILAEVGASVVGPVGNLEDALDQVANAEFDAAILDIHLRGELVYPVANELVARGVPFLFSTAYNEREIPPDYRHHVRVEKPYTARGLLRSLVELVRDRDPSGPR